MNRRHFITQSLSVAAAIGTGITTSAQATQPAGSDPKDVTNRPRTDVNTINEFVGAGHGNLPRVKEMLAQESAAQKRLGGLIMAERELGVGDFETALGGASHMGRPDIAMFLLSQGARMDAFCAAMLGFREVVAAMLKAAPETATTKGPHLYTLLYHAAISGNVGIAEDIKPHLPAGATDFGQALTSAARHGKLPMTRWLLENGATDPNAKDGFGKTALMHATENNFPEVADELRKHGAK